MDLKSLSRRQLQALTKKNKLPANITNVAMANALNSLDFIEGIEEILNQSESGIAHSPTVPPTGGKSRTVKSVGVSTPVTRRRAAAASTSVRKKIKVSSKESLDEIEEVKKDVSVKTPAPASRIKGVRETSTVKHVYSPRRSARLAKKIEEPKDISEAIEISSFTEVIEENVDRSENSEISVLDNFKESEAKRNESKDISEETSEIPNVDVAVASIGQMVFSDIKTNTDQNENEQVRGLVSEEVCVMETEASIRETKMCPFIAQEAKAPIKDTEMNSNMDEETEASIEKVAIIDSNVNEASSEDGEIKSYVDEATTVVSIEEDTDINTKDDEENDIAIIKADSCNMVNEQEAYADEIENDGYMVDGFAVNIQKTNDKELPSKNGSSNDMRETSTVKHAHSTRRSARLSDKIEEPKEISEAIKISSFPELIDKNVYQSENSEITVLDNFKESAVKRNDESKEISEETSEIPNGDAGVTRIGQKVSSDFKTDTDQNKDKPVHGLVSEEVCNRNLH